ncbi:MAG: WHG domain-containing protein [Pseudomonadota bacterium]
MGAQNAARREKLPKAAVGKKPLPKPVSVKKISPSAAKSAHKADRDQPYHHGDLHEALLLAAKRVAERDGFNGLTLRAVAREAGVSHAAPAHHFGDITGLLSELAAIGFQQFSAALGAATCTAASTEAAELGRANAYVAFARDNPCMFQLMFRAERLDHSRPVLQEASKAAFTNLASIVGARRHEEIALDHLTLPQAADVARIWSLVHGFAMLYLDGRLQYILDAAPGITEEMLLAAMLKSH